MELHNPIISTLLEKITAFKKEKDILPFVKIPSIKANYEVVIITATIDEYHSFSQYLTDSEIIEFANEPSLYLKGLVKGKNGKKLSAIMPIPSEMGVASASINTTKSILHFNPKYIFMTGICAGIKTITKLGDILICEKSLDYNEVVEIENRDSSVRTKFMNNIISINSRTKSEINLFIKNYTFEQNDLQQKFNLEHNLKVHVGLLITGSSLLRNGEKIRQLTEAYHNVKGLDMETYGVYKAIQSFDDRNGKINFLSIKSVSDFATNDKDKALDNLDKRNLALHNSSLFLKQYIENYL